MIPVPVDVRGLAVRRDVRGGTWQLSGWGHDHVLREWTWGERQRLVDGCVGSSGLDTHAFVHALLGLLLRPAAPSGLEPLYACVALGLLGVEAGRRVEPLVDAQVRVARAFGWGPAELDAQPAAEVDRMLRAAVAPRSATPPATGAVGWNSIVVVGDNDAQPGSSDD